MTGQNLTISQKSFDHFSHLSKAYASRIFLSQAFSKEKKIVFSMYVGQILVSMYMLKKVDKITNIIFFFWLGFRRKSFHLM